jgi:hypothetical protein
LVETAGLLLTFRSIHWEELGMDHQSSPDLDKLAHGNAPGDPQIGALYPPEEQAVEFAAGDPDRPVQMLNLLKYRDRAQYAGAGDEPGCTGREAYARYIEAAGKSIQDAQGLLCGTARSEIF